MRSTPILFGLFSLVTLMANTLIKDQTKVVRTAAYSNRPLVTHWRW
ncbi:MAG: hypothetical protein AAB401_05620 [Acidobacteriota bacterium]